MFEAHYKKLLAKRLIFGRSADYDSEKQMLLRLKTECGPVFTNKLEGMFKDIEISKDLVRSFKSSHKEQLLATAVNVLVLTDGFWPTEAIVLLKNLPKEILEYQQSFEKFYLGTFSGRRLTWMNSLSHCTIIGNFERGSKELQVSTFQACVLFCFNTNESDPPALSAAQIRDVTGLEESDLERTLQSLSLGKERLLLKSTKVSNHILSVD